MIPTSVFEVTRKILPLMRREGRGRIVNIGSLAGKEGLPNLAIYSAASAGVIAFTKALAREACDSDIRVNCVAPGPIDTALIRGLGEIVVDEMITASPLKRFQLEPVLSKRPRPISAGGAFELITASATISPKQGCFGGQALRIFVHKYGVRAQSVRHGKLFSVRSCDSEAHLGRVRNNGEQ